MFLFRETTTWCSETVAVSIGGCGLYFVLVPFWLKDEGAGSVWSFEAHPAHPGLLPGAGSYLSLGR